MRSTIEPGIPGMFGVPAVALHYYAGRSLDEANHPAWSPEIRAACKAGIAEQQFSLETYEAAENWYAKTDYLGWIQPGVEAVFAYEHFSRFEAAPRVWPPLVPASYWCAYFGVYVSPEHAEVCDVCTVLSYRRDYATCGNQEREGESRDFCPYLECGLGIQEPHMHYRLRCDRSPALLDCREDGRGLDRKEIVMLLRFYGLPADLTAWAELVRKRFPAFAPGPIVPRKVKHGVRHTFDAAMTEDEREALMPEWRDGWNMRIGYKELYRSVSLPAKSGGKRG